MRTNEHFQVAIAGSGFSGLGMAIRLKQTGTEDFVVLERAGGLGGTWRDNTYPGCACDVESQLYSFSFAPNPDWTRTFAPQAEIHAYLKRCAAEFGVEDRIRFDTELLGAAWDAEAAVWRIDTSRGPLTAEVLVGAFGPLSEPALPDLPGMERFAGAVFHSARWDHGQELDGARVGVIGTGASAIQFVPHLQPHVDHLVLFQRTPAWIVPRRDRPLSARRRRRYRRAPVLLRASRWSRWARRELLLLAFLGHPRLERLLEGVARRHLRTQVADPALRAALTPDYAIGCKRLLLSDDFYPAVAQPNVDVVRDGVREVTPTGIVTSGGQTHALDVLILATGFHVTQVSIADRLRGEGGVTLSARWAGSPRANAGSTVVGFPNLFLLAGPNTGVGHTSLIVMLEAQFEHVLDALAGMRRQDASALVVREEAVERYNADVNRRAAPTVWASGCASWYRDSCGRLSALWPGSTVRFRRVSRFDARDYRTLQPARRAHDPPSR